MVEDFSTQFSPLYLPMKLMILGHPYNFLSHIWVKEAVVNFTYVIRISYVVIDAIYCDVGASALQSHENINFYEDIRIRRSLTNYPNYRPRIGVISRARCVLRDRSSRLITR